MKRLLLLFVLFIVVISTNAQSSPLKMVNFHKLPNDIVDLYALKQKAGRDCDFDSNKAALIRVKAQGFNEKTMLDFSVFPKPGIEIIYKEFRDGEMWLYVSSKCMGTIVFKYMGEFEFTLPSKLEPKAGYELTLGMETATLMIRAIPSDAEIYIDGTMVGKGYASSAVAIGAEHRYKVVCNDYWPKEGTVYFEKREVKELNFDLEPNFGYITISSVPSEAEVYIDDTKVGITPYQVKKIKLGQHTVELRKSGYKTVADIISIRVGDHNKRFENVRLEQLDNTKESAEPKVSTKSKEPTKSKESTKPKVTTRTKGVSLSKHLGLDINLGLTTQNLTNPKGTYSLAGEKDGSTKGFHFGVSFERGRRFLMWELLDLGVDYYSENYDIVTNYDTLGVAVNTKQNNKLTSTNIYFAPVKLQLRHHIADFCAFYIATGPALDYRVSVSSSSTIDGVTQETKPELNSLYLYWELKAGVMFHGFKLTAGTSFRLNDVYNGDLTDHYVKVGRPFYITLSYSILKINYY